MRCHHIIASIAVVGQVVLGGPTGRSRRAVDEKCLSQQPCTFNYEPVCGSDGHTYANECVLKANVKCGAVDLKKVSEGECPSTTTTNDSTPTECAPKMCTADFRPVCANDGKTYGNLCQLQSAQCENPKLQKVSDGECPTTTTTGTADPTPTECGPKICTADFRPVCGSDGQTYSNLCLLEVAQCENPNLAKVSDGECEPECPIIACTLEYFPVCGSNGKTFDNKCRLQAAACDDPTIKLVKEGACTAHGVPSDCMRPTNVLYWTGKAFSVPGNRTGVQVAASWNAPKGPKSYLICYEVELNAQKTSETCVQYELKNGNGGNVTWDTGAAIFALGSDAPSLRSLSVEIAGNEDAGCIAIGDKDSGSFKVSCNSTNASEVNAVKKVSLEKDEKNSASKEVSLRLTVDANPSVHGVKAWERCTNRVRVDGMVRAFCSYQEASKSDSGFETTIKGLSTKNTESFFVGVRAIGQCPPPVLSNKVSV